MALCLLALASGANAQQADVDTAATGDSSPGPGGNEIVVTATRQAQLLSRVPISVAAFDQAQMDRQGVRRVDDLVRLTPGLNLTRGETGSNTISIRGISSSAGASTTGVYIDDTPIQARGVGYNAGTAFPVIFDLERVEVLRGPQGTLFGAGSQGGTVRFIQPQASVTESSGYARAEVLQIENGGAGYEAGIALGAPLVQDKLGFRASVYYRHDPGYIDAVYGSFSVVDPTGELGEDSIAFAPTGIAEKNTDWRNTFTARLALNFEPSETISIKPSIAYQRIYQQEAIRSFWPILSDPDSGVFATPRFVATAPDATRVAMDAPPAQPSNDKFYLPALLIEAELPFAQFVANTSYFHRDERKTFEFTQAYAQDYAGRLVPLPGDRAVSPTTNQQRTFTQEIRLQSREPGSRLNWVVGGFYSRMRQASLQRVDTNFFSELDNIFGVTAEDPPFGGTQYASAFLNYYGMEPLNGGVTSWVGNLYAKETQLAGFGQVDFKLTDTLTLTAGVRVSENKLTFTTFYDGPENNLNAPAGRPCPLGEGACVPAEGPYTPRFANGGASTKEHAVTPKFSASWQATPDDLFYATVSKGFRPGGAQTGLPIDCESSLIANGFVDAQGNTFSPESYDSDSVWNYEAGAKNRLFGGRVRTDGSVYMIKWTNIQTSIFLPSCQLSVATNLGSATSRGFDLAAQVDVMEGLTLGTSIGYNKTTFDDARLNTSGGIVVSERSGVPNSGSPWTVSANGQYDFAFRQTDTYLRADVTYASGFRRTGSTDPLTVNYDPLSPPRPSSVLANIRAGLLLGDADISLFVNNVANAHPQLGYGRSRAGTVNFTDNTFQPRTFGITAAYRF